MKILKRTMLLLTFLMLASCGKEEVVKAELEASSLKSGGYFNEEFGIVLNTNGNKKWKKDVTAYFDPKQRIYTALVPEGTDVTALLPRISSKTSMQYIPQGPQDFTVPVDYEVMSSGTIQKIKIKVKVGYTDHDVMRAIYWANKDLERAEEWYDNLDDPNLENWEGVFTNSEGNISYLTLFSNIKVLPPEIGGLKDLDSLYMWNSARLRTLPSEIGNLKNLKKINIIHCGLTTLPLEIGQLTNLTELQVYGNKLKFIPEGIFELTQLIKLDLGGMHLSNMPVGIGKLVSLKSLSLAISDFETFPLELLQLKELEHLNFRFNDLSGITKRLGELTKLKTLNLYSNNLISLPKELGQLTHLETLELRANNLTSLHKSICDLELQGTTKIDIVPGEVACVY